MSPLTIFLSKLSGCSALLTSLSMFLYRQSVVESAATLIHDRPLWLIVGMIALICGLSVRRRQNRAGPPASGLGGLEEPAARCSVGIGRPGSF